MKGIERFDLTDKVARTLQDKMGFDDIRHYLKRFEIEFKNLNDSYSSKWTYAKDILVNASDSTIVQIADDLGIPHGFTVVAPKIVIESKFWVPNHLRLFLSHLSSFKEKTNELRVVLKKFAISGFVAHADIEPSKEWMDEIETALFSMDALAAILTPQFFESKWADQEVGVAIGRRLLIIPVMREATPHGFISKYQGINGAGKSVHQVAESIFKTLLHAPQTNNRMVTCLIDATALAQNEIEAKEKLELLASPICKDIPKESFERLLAGVGQVILGSNTLRTLLIKLLKAKGVDLPLVGDAEPVQDDDVPF